MISNYHKNSTRKRVFLSFVILILTLPSAAVVFMAWSGFFSNAEVSEHLMGPYYMVYADYSGPYGGARNTMDSLKNILEKEDGISAADKFIYYENNPRNYESKALNAEAGIILKNSDTLLINDLRKKYKLRILPRQHFVSARIPFRSGISLFAGRVKIYPAIITYKKEHQLMDAPFIEIYTNDKKVLYLSPSRPGLITDIKTN
ncbi:MAG: hypothetical protein KUL83_09185 [Lentimicrobium sp.]|jgi:hypothetical protein|nr:hypothetical protein [Lentimicrobium sp.]MDD2527350.1 hypothetical protein [Lentimicrobiaceae bacterium]MDD4599015.1 hypothetical protein [Lentimicrobiaceae bacterium]MDY0026690.1 hypothetical protein [Lentimicrobium sp.]